MWRTDDAPADCGSVRGAAWSGVLPLRPAPERLRLPHRPALRGQRAEAPVRGLLPQGDGSSARPGPEKPERSGAVGTAAGRTEEVPCPLRVSLTTRITAGT